MGPEINVNSILALEKQIEEGVGDVTHLKRARNSLLNVFMRIPPEILEHVFRWSAIQGDPGGLRKGSYNFLLVCHRWFEVASNTPELWTYPVGQHSETVVAGVSTFWNPSHRHCIACVRSHGRRE